MTIDKRYLGEANHAGVCLCGCGRATNIARRTNYRKGHTAGLPVRYALGHHHYSETPKARCKYVRRKGHPKAGTSGCVREHILIVEAALGHYLPEGTEVHHVDGNPRNNANSNLVICQDRAYHCLLHRRMRVKAAGGNPNTDAWCSSCKRPRPLGLFTYHLTGRDAGGLVGHCRDCNRLKARARKQRMRAAQEAVA